MNKQDKGVIRDLLSDYGPAALLAEIGEAIQELKDGRPPMEGPATS